MGAIVQVGRGADALHSTDFWRRIGSAQTACFPPDGALRSAGCGSLPARFDRVLLFEGRRACTEQYRRAAPQLDLVATSATNLYRLPPLPGSRGVGWIGRGHARK